jgi:alpha-mannosidase
VMVDKVYDDSLQRYAQVRQLSEPMIQASLDYIIRRIQTAGKGVPITVFNMLGWRRTEVAEVEVPFSDPGVHNFALLDPEGHAIPYQILNAARNDYGGLRQARVAFLAREVPGLGYAVYHAVPNAEGVASAPENKHDTTREDQADMENEFFRASLNLWNGDLTSLVLKGDNWQALAAPGNTVAREYDGGDFWELYGTLNGARFTSMKKPILAPRPNYTQWSSDFVGGGGSISTGPVFSEFHIVHPLGKNQIRTQIRMYQGLPRIDITTELVNQEEFVRYRAIFPTSIRNGKAVHEIPFGAIERPESQEYPAQNWIDYSDGAHGFSLINQGMPGNNVSDGKLMLSLMRSTKLISYGFIGGYQPGVGSDSGLGLGKTYKLNYAIVPHSGDWRSAQPWRTGMAFNNPLIVRTADSHNGDLPARWGLAEISNDNVVVSALKPSRSGSAAIRVYEASGQAQSGVRASWGTRVSEISEVNFLEEQGSRLTGQGKDFVFDLKPYQIKTFRVQLQAIAPDTAPRARQ